MSDIVFTRCDVRKTRTLGGLKTAYGYLIIGFVYDMVLCCCALLLTLQ